MHSLILYCILNLLPINRVNIIIIVVVVVVVVVVVFKLRKSNNRLQRASWLQGVPWPSFSALTLLVGR